ncbi:MAG: DUF2180 family protein [Acidobacteriota bacterium]
MRCYPCHDAGRSTEAVALCPHCSIGLCADHRASLAVGSPGGSGLGCGHALPAASRKEQPVVAAA